MNGVSTLTRQYHRIVSPFSEYELSIGLCDPKWAKYNIQGLYRFHDTLQGYPIFKKDKFMFYFDSDLNYWAIKYTNQTIVSSTEPEVKSGSFIDIKYQLKESDWFLAYQGEWINLEMKALLTLKDSIDISDLYLNQALLPAEQTTTSANIIPIIDITTPWGLLQESLPAKSTTTRRTTTAFDQPNNCKTLHDGLDMIRVYGTSGEIPEIRPFSDSSYDYYIGEGNIIQKKRSSGKIYSLARTEYEMEVECINGSGYLSGGFGGGDSCGSKVRKVNLRLICNNNNHYNVITSVMEHETCVYDMDIEFNCQRAVIPHSGEDADEDHSGDEDYVYSDDEDVIERE